MVSIRAEINTATSADTHNVVTVWAGPDPDHRANCGSLMMRPSEAKELLARIAAGESGSTVAEGVARDAITPQIARHVLWRYNAIGSEAPDAATRSLILLISQADVAMRRRLALAYPGYVQAMFWAESGGGLNDLREIAEAGR